MFELRWNPIIKWWVMVASSRQKRPLLPKDRCPFCPGSGKVPEKYDVFAYDNDFPILSPEPPEVTSKESQIYKSAKSYGKCEVVLYSSDHNTCLGDLSIQQIEKLIDLWIDRYVSLGKEKHIKYVFIFENRGEEVGVTIHHPHGQIYAFPFIPRKIEIELESSLEHYKKTGNCIHCDILKEELSFKERVVDRNGSFVTFVPFFADYPYQTFVISKNHKQSIDQLDKKEKHNLALSLKKITKTYDKIFNKPFPYMMCFHQKPSDEKYSHYHFHVEFYPPMRNEKTQKFNASSETGSWTNGNPTSPEEKAQELTRILKKM